MNVLLDYRLALHRVSRQCTFEGLAPRGMVLEGGPLGGIRLDEVTRDPHKGVSALMGRAAETGFAT